MEMKELDGQGWKSAQMPRLDDEKSVIARVDDIPIKAGVKTETVEKTSTTLHERFRTGVYDVDLRIAPEAAQVRVRRNEAYGKQKV